MTCYKRFNQNAKFGQILQVAMYQFIIFFNPKLFISVYFCYKNLIIFRVINNVTQILKRSEF